jgi:hypothetical protein
MKFSKNSPRSQRGFKWQEKLLSELLKKNYIVDDVREYYQKQGIEDTWELCKLEHKYGDLIIRGPKNTYIECITVPADKSSIFPERKLKFTGDNCWFAFEISDGQRIYVAAQVWNKYVVKLDQIKIHGKYFRRFHAKNLINLRSKHSNIESFCPIPAIPGRS